MQHKLIYKCCVLLWLSPTNSFTEVSLSDGVIASFNMCCTCVCIVHVCSFTFWSNCMATVNTGKDMSTSSLSPSSELIGQHGAPTSDIISTSELVHDHEPQLLSLYSQVAHKCTCICNIIFHKVHYLYTNTDQYDGVITRANEDFSTH